MSPNPLKSASLDDIAADWLLRSDRGLTLAEERHLADWLALDPRHESAFLAAEETWHRLGAVGPRALAPAAPVVPRAARRWRLPLSLAAAAAVAGAALVGWQTWRSDHASYEIAAETTVGGLRALALPDGSIIRLNTDTRLNVVYTQQDRRITLAEGEAHFAVARNKARPFLVSACGVAVRAVGTAFNVRLRDAAVEVFVTEGRVRLGDTPGSPETARPRLAVTEIAAGEKATFVRQSREAVAPVPAVVAPVSAAAARQALAWQERRLDFDDVPFGEMIAEINRYSREKLVVGDPQLRAERFGGSFPTGDTDTVLRMLEENFGVVAERRGDTTVLRVRPR